MADRRPTRCSTLARMSTDAVPWAGRPVAIVHDWFQGYHGSERVVEVLADDVLAEAAPGRRPHLPGRPRAAAAAAGRRGSSASRGSRGCRGCARSATTRAAGATCCPTCRATSARSTSPATPPVVVSSHACAINASPPARHALPLLLPHADALRLAGRHRARPARRRPRRGAGALSGWLRRQRPRGGAAARPAGRQLDRRARTRIDRFYEREAEVVHPPVEVGELRPPTARRAAALPLGQPPRPLQAAAARSPRPSAACRTS